MPSYTRQTNMFGNEKTKDAKKYADIAFHLKNRFENWFGQFFSNLIKDDDYTCKISVTMLNGVYGSYTLNLSLKHQCYLHLFKNRIPAHEDSNMIKAQDRTFLDYVIKKFSDSFPFAFSFKKFGAPKKKYTYNNTYTNLYYEFDVDTYNMEETGSDITGINETETFVENIMKDAGYHVMTAPNDTLKYDEFEKLALPMKGCIKPGTPEITLYVKYNPLKKKKFYYKDGGNNMKPIAIKTIYNLYRKGIMNEI